jgi:predicted outer membrane repeat protein
MAPQRFASLAGWRGLLAASAALLAASTAEAQIVFFVDDDAPPGGDGLTWATAMRNPQDALAVAPPGSILRVAQGLYRPDEGAGQVRYSPYSSFKLDRSLQLYGGYRGLVGGGLPGDRDVEAFPTVLNGDLLDNAPADWDNCLQIIRVTTPSPTVIDGFVLTDGGNSELSVSNPSFAQGKAIYHAGGVMQVRNLTVVGNRGSALYTQGSDLRAWDCSFSDNGNGVALNSLASVVQLTRCVFEDDASAVFAGGSLNAQQCRFARNLQNEGGAARADGAVATFVECQFEDNEAYSETGGALSWRNASLTLVRCTARRNFARTGFGRGGAIYCHNQLLTIDACVFEDNEARGGGGAVTAVGSFAITGSRFVGNRATNASRGGAVSLESEGTLSHCTFADNFAGFWGGAVAWRRDLAPVGAVEHCTFFRNQSTNGGGGIHFPGALGGTVRNSILWANVGGPGGASDQIGSSTVSAVVEYCDVQGGHAGPGNLDLDPSFLSVSALDLRLAAGSPCIDTGDPASPLDPDGSRADMGAEPFDPGACPPIFSYCTNPASSSGCVSSFGWTGTPSASFATPFTIHVSEVEGQRQALFFYGVGGADAAPFTSTVSTRCVATPVQRTATQSSGGAAGACDGTLQLDWNAQRAAHPGALGEPFAVGDTVWMQAWIRDPAGPGSTYLSDALQFSHCY